MEIVDIVTWQAAKSKAYNMDYGAERRDLILSVLKFCAECQNNDSEIWAPIGIAINCSGCFILQKDRDLKYLLKRGKIKLVRTWHGWSKRNNITYVVLA